MNLIIQQKNKEGIKRGLPLGFIDSINFSNNS